MVADIARSAPCLKFDDTLSRLIGGVNNHLNCLVFYTGENCEGVNFIVDAQPNDVNFEEYAPSETYYGMRLCGNVTGPKDDVNILKAAHVTLNLSNH